MKINSILLAGVALTFLGQPVLSADKTVTNLPAASALSGPELLLGVQSGANKKITIDQVKTYVGGGTGTGFLGPVAGTYTSPNGCYVFDGVDGTPQFAIGCTTNSAEYFQALGGVTGAGATLLARNSAQTGNVNGGITAQGAGNILYGNSGHGTMATVLDPGNNSINPVQMTPAIASNLPVKIGNSAGGINLDCGTSANCQGSGVPLGFHDVQTFFSAGTFTWTAKANIVWVRARGCGGGGAGGSGALEISGIVASGGGGGAGGGCFDETFRASDLGASLNVFIGAGGASVAGQTTNTTAGLNGSGGGYTCLGGASASPSSSGSVICGGGGGGGAGGQLAATASGGGGAGAVNGSGSSSTTGAGAGGAFGLAGAGGSGSNGTSSGLVGVGASGAGTSTAGVGGAGGSSIDACGGGGSGGGVAAAASNNGGAGGNAFRAYKQGANPAGGTSGTPTGGSITPQFPTYPGFGGGGGYGNFSGAAGAGGNGTQCGGGGGGGTALNGSTAGASGKGGDGWMEVTSW